MSNVTVVKRVLAAALPVRAGACSVGLAHDPDLAVDVAADGRITSFLRVNVFSADGCVAAHREAWVDLDTGGNDSERAVESVLRSWLDSLSVRLREADPHHVQPRDLV